MCLISVMKPIDNKNIMSMVWCSQVLRERFPGVRLAENVCSVDALPEVMNCDD